MALSDAIDYLTEVNEKTMEEQELTNLHIEELTDRVTSLLEFNKQDRLERLEQMRESARAFEAPSMTGGSAGAAGPGNGGGLMDAIGGIGGALVGFFGLKAFLGTLSTFSGKLLKMFKGVGRFLGPLGLVITAIIGAFATVEGFLKGYEEDGLLGGLEGAVKGFVDSIIAAPLDLLKNIVAFIADKLGFKLTAQALRDFSFSELFDSMITSIFDGLQNVVNVVTDIFSFPEDGGPLQNFGNLFDTVMLGINIAINFIGTIFGFIQPDEPFRLSTFLSNTIKSAMNFIMEDVFKFDAIDTDQTLMGFLGDLFKSIFDTLMQTAVNFGKSIQRDIDMTVTAFGFTFMNMFDQLLLAIQNRVRIKLPELPGSDLKIGIGPASFTVPKGAFLAGQEFGVGDPNVTQARMEQRQVQMLETIKQYEDAGGGLYSGYFDPVMSTVDGGALRSMNGAAGMTGGGGSVVINNIDQSTTNAGGGSGGVQATTGAYLSAGETVHLNQDPATIIGGAPRGGGGGW